MKAATLALLCLALALPLAAAGGTALPKVVPFEQAPSLLVSNCSACHDWAASPASLLSSGRIVPGKPAESLLVARIGEGSMPPDGVGLPAEERDAIRTWVEKGALLGPDAGSAATLPAEGAASAGAAGYLGFPSKAAFHRFAGWTSGGLLLAAGTVGAIRAFDLRNGGHLFRDANGGEDAFNDGNHPACTTEIQSLWSSDQWLRWTHVGLLVSGESLYLANAVTGIEFINPNATGVRRSTLHRWAFFVHGGLMVAEAVLGFVTTDALKRGDHRLVSSLGVAHAAIGIAIPVTIFASGAIQSLPLPP